MSDPEHNPSADKFVFGAAVLIAIAALLMFMFCS
jgi:hypothetical protein